MTPQQEKDIMSIPSKAWTPSINEDEELTLANIIGQAIGTGSVCWTTVPEGIFDSERAQWVVDGAVAAVEKLHDTPGAEQLPTLPNTL